MFQEHETLRFIPGRETDDAEPNVEDEECLLGSAARDFGHELIHTVFRVQPAVRQGLEDTIKRKFKKFVEEFTCDVALRVLPCFL